ncbi:uncharacterized protein ARMOST_18981 [Armillaria ostoyae]|uniref:Uncharacterized protein n=1 Tax=Armillaria ostoyae TaxID=47428 RepID=A0A284S386_ARMOS|nr:uncharacterized protein ARMOST_18981 [Armillaria ostoyae]
MLFNEAFTPSQRWLMTLFLQVFADGAVVRQKLNGVPLCLNLPTATKDPRSCILNVAAPPILSCISIRHIEHPKSMHQLKALFRKTELERAQELCCDYLPFHNTATIEFEILIGA